MRKWILYAVICTFTIWKKPIDAVLEIKRYLKRVAGFLYQTLLNTQMMRQKRNCMTHGQVLTLRILRSFSLEEGFKKIDMGTVKEQTGKRGKKKKTGCFLYNF
jgi:hypothetical protein